MENNQNTIGIIVSELSECVAPLAASFTDLGRFRSLLIQLGWSDAPLNALPSFTTQIPATLGMLSDLLDELLADDIDPKAAISKTGELIVALKQLSDSLQTLKNSIDLPSEYIAAGFLTEFPRQMMDYAVINHLLRFWPRLGYLLAVLGIIRRKFTPGEGVRVNHYAHRIVFEELALLKDDPAALFKNAFAWGTDDFDADLLLQYVRNLFSAFRTYNGFERISPQKLAVFGTPGSAGNAISAFKASFFDYVENEARVNAGVGFFPLPKNDTALPGLSILPFASGSFRQKTELFSDFFFQFDASVNLQGGLGIAFRPEETPQIVLGFDEPESAAFASGIVKISLSNEDISGAAVLLLGDAEGSRVSYKSLAIAGGMAVSTEDKPVLFIESDLKGGEIAIMPGQGDGFIQKLLPKDGITSKFDVAIGISTQQGLYFRSSGGLDIALPAHLDLGPVELENILLTLSLENGRVRLDGGAGVKAVLGPLSLHVENIGISGYLSLSGDWSGNLGLFDTSVNFKPPDGAGLAVDASLVKGGGYLRFFDDRKQYEGAMELSFAEGLSLKAIGLVATRMPDGSKGFSLLIIITAEFGTGIQLGFGFSLLGVGGLLGLHRGANVEALLQGVRNGGINNVMFPRDVAANAPRIISDLRAFFPPEEGKFLIGPMFKLGWGSPVLVHISLGVVVEFNTQGGFSVDTLTILGVLKVNMPTEAEARLVLQVQFLGRVEFKLKRAWFYAALYESRLLSITIDGQMGLLMDWSDNANFVLSVGGFHPQFTPPPLPFPAPQRIAIELSNSSAYRLRVEGYFAVTSNTAQFGAKLFAKFELGSFVVEGHLSFDALFQFSPFYFVVDISGSVSLRIFGLGVFGIRLDFALSGPNPWRAKGKGSIGFLFWSFSANFDVTWGNQDATTALPPVRVFPLVKGELERSENWNAELPAGQHVLVTLRKLDGTGPDQLTLHPLGQLRITQRLAPMGITLDKVGNQKPEDYRKINLSETTGKFSAQPALESFAMGQYQEMDDSEKLTRPAFQPQQGGVALTAAGQGGYKTGLATRRFVRYETIIIDTEYKRHVKPFVKWIGTLFNYFMKGNAVSKSPLSQRQQGLRDPFPEKVEIQGDLYVVVSAANMAPVSEGFASEALAREYLQNRVRAEPALREELQVVPHSEIN